MQDSIMLHWIWLFITRTMSFYKNSWLNRVLLWVLTPIVKAWDESAFARLLFHKPHVDNGEQQSIFWRLLMVERVVLKSFASRLGQPIRKKIQKSVIFSFVKSMFDNAFFIPLSVYGSMLVAAACTAIVFALLQHTMLGKMFVVKILVLIIGWAMTFLHKSFAYYWRNSKLDRWLRKAWESDAFFAAQTNTLPYRMRMIATVLGILLVILMKIVSFKIALLILGGVFFIILMIWQPMVGVALVTMLTPFAPTMAVAGLIVLTYIGLLMRYLLHVREKFIFDSLGIWIAVFMGIYLFNAFTSYEMVSSLKIALMVSAMMSYYFLLYNLIDSKKQFKLQINLFLTAGFAVALYGIFQHFSGNAANAWIDKSMFSDISGRVSATFANPNVLGEYLILLIPIAFVWTITRKNIVAKWFFGLNTFALSLCMVFTYSRGCWLGLLLAVAVFILFYDRRYILGCMLAGAVSIVFLPQNVINRFASIGNLADSSSSYRVSIWVGTMKLLDQFWFCGIGPGIDAFNRVYPNFSHSAVTAPHAHSLYFVVLTEMGLAGIVSLVVIMWVFFQRSTSSLALTKDRTARLLNIAIIAAMTGFFFQGFFDYVWYNYRVVTIFWGVLAFAMINRKLVIKEMGENTWKDN
ncbi:MAG: O-antigen ligase family protein [Hyphomonadaceae bacterium]|nr:O-antigen ligase family protein [Clostridia bacterium]